VKFVFLLSCGEVLTEPRGGDCFDGNKFQLFWNYADEVKLQLGQNS